MIQVIEKYGAPGETRTPDPLLRRQTLYPAELRAHLEKSGQLILLRYDGNFTNGGDFWTI
jgi:hypothetical protein